VLLKDLVIALLDLPHNDAWSALPGELVNAPCHPTFFATQRQFTFSNRVSTSMSSGAGSVTSAWTQQIAMPRSTSGRSRKHWRRASRLRPLRWDLPEDQFGGANQSCSNGSLTFDRYVAGRRDGDSYSRRLAT
jgi:hypothetical protein